MCIHLQYVYIHIYTQVPRVAKGTQKDTKVTLRHPKEFEIPKNESRRDKIFKSSRSTA